MPTRSRLRRLILFSAILVGCDGASSVLDRVDSSVDAATAFPPTSLAVDCRPATTSMLDTESRNPTAPECAGPRGSGALREPVLGGFYDEASRTFFLYGLSLVMTVDRDAGDAAVLSGRYDDPVTVTEVVGTGVEWTPFSLAGLRPWIDGEIAVFSQESEGRFYRVDRATGERTWLGTGPSGLAPSGTRIRTEAGFALDDGGLLFFALASTFDGGCGVLRCPVDRTEPGAVVTLSGAADPFQLVGMGPNDGTSEYADIEYYDGAIWLLNPDRDGLLVVDVATGDRRYVSMPGVIGTDIDGTPHLVAAESAGAVELFFSPSTNTAITFASNGASSRGQYATRIDLASGGRGYPSEFWDFASHSPWFARHLGTELGRVIHYDDAHGLIYTAQGTTVAVIDLAAGNVNYIHRE